MMLYSISRYVANVAHDQHVCGHVRIDPPQSDIKKHSSHHIVDIFRNVLGNVFSFLKINDRFFLTKHIDLV